ncbi:MAG: LysM peptidoglycan-binding domain-containing protein [Deltaproteobacteria bacterium]|nr:MAG: LysM peptidoglycan-binding domain-containing protein [Deltaproteobacteria bacterium]
MIKKQTIRKIRSLALLGLALLWIIAGCATVDKYVAQIHKKLPSWAKKSRSQGSYYFHKVRYPGESLSVIAKWYTGDVQTWRHLAKANPKLDPERIGIGTTVFIPENLLHTKKAMPKEFVDAVAKRHKTRKAQVAKTKRQSWYYYHKVKYPGESLSIIAKWYTGDVKNWPFLAKVNPELDPNRITVGDKIRIPNKLLHIQKPMPRSFIAGSAKRKKSKPSQVKTARTAKKEPEPSTTTPPDKQPEVFELFGPK